MEQLHAIQKLRLFIAFVHPDHDGHSVTKFVAQLHPQGWIISKTQCSFPYYGDSVVGTSLVLIGIHNSTQSKVNPLMFKMPPTWRPLPLSSFIWQPFHKLEFQLSFARNNPWFETNDTECNVATLPLPTLMASIPAGLMALYFLHRCEINSLSLNGSAVVSLDSLCPQFDRSPLFCYHFGVEFNCNDHTYVRAISPFKFALNFGFTNNLRYHLSQPDHWFALIADIPALTSVWIFDHIYERLCAIRNSNTENFPPRQYAAPAAHIQAFVYGTIATRLPDWQRWIDAYNSDPDLSRVHDIVSNPATLSKDTLKDIPFNYHSALRQALIVIDDDMLIYRKPIAGGMSYIKLILVPTSLRNILFIAFHSNALGGHFDAYRTLHRLRLCYYWPGMYTYIKRCVRHAPVAPS